MNNEVRDLPVLPEDDRPHELHTDFAGEDVAQESVRRHNARQVAHTRYPYKLEGTTEENDELRQLREQTIESGAKTIRKAETVVNDEHKRLKHLYEASDGQEEIRIEDFESNKRSTDE